MQILDPFVLQIKVMLFVNLTKSGAMDINKMYITDSHHGDLRSVMFTKDL